MGQTVRPSGVFAKVNRVRFTQQGNKFGACDGDGNVAFWQASNATAPFFNYHCHSKGTSDFVFQGGSSSLFCTVGHSGDGKNVALWDTLMPQRRSLVESYTFHESGASALLFAPQHNQLVTVGKKGHVAIWDIRQHRQLHCFKAHDHPIKCLAIDPNEEFFVTGSVDGDIKVWSLSNHKWIYTFNEEHTRHGILKIGFFHVELMDQSKYGNFLIEILLLVLFNKLYIFFNFTGKKNREINFSYFEAFLCGSIKVRHTTSG